HRAVGLFFFFQAEDGIRDKLVTGVQTCCSSDLELGSVAVKSGVVPRPEDAERIDADPLRCVDPQASARMVEEVDAAKRDADTLRSEERRVGKECRSRWLACDEKENKR